MHHVQQPEDKDLSQGYVSGYDISARLKNGELTSLLEIWDLGITGKIIGIWGLHPYAFEFGITEIRFGFGITVNIKYAEHVR